jgi:glutaminyl-tRNA synthetase
MEDPPRKFFRLGPGREVRLKYACYVTCTDFVKDENGEVTEVRCSWDPDSRGACTPDGRKVKGTIHWLSAAHALPAKVHLYDRLFTVESPDGVEGKDYHEFINPESKQTIDAWVEPAVAEAVVGKAFQFERKGYFCLDKDSAEDALVINRTVGMRDSWAKKAGK